MNLDTLQAIIASYKTKFSYIHDREIYKWKAIQHFRDHWNIDNSNFWHMLESSLAKTHILMDTRNYFPKRMILRYAEKEPETVRELFRSLYAENVGLAERIESFQNGISELNAKYYSGKNDYQDLRAIIVYLVLRYPDRYFLFKFTMFKSFARIIDHEAVMQRKYIPTVVEYQAMCQIIRSIIKNDNELLRLHQQRLSAGDYADTDLTVLTQDIIYAATMHLKDVPLSGTQNVTLTEVSAEIEAVKSIPSLRPAVINWLENERKAKEIGDIGELMVLQYEKQFLLSKGITDLLPERISSTKGDGAGYDILSYTEDRQPKYIEVKATHGKYANPFIITNAELKLSMDTPEQFYLYRLFDIDERNRSAKFIIRRGSLEDLCINPIKYSVTMKNSDTALTRHPFDY